MDLQEATLHEILDELISRELPALVIGFQEPYDPRKADEITTHSAGNGFTAEGMASSIIDDIKDSRRSVEEDLEDLEGDEWKNG